MNIMSEENLQVQGNSQVRMPDSGSPVRVAPSKGNVPGQSISVADKSPVFKLEISPKQQSDRVESIEDMSVQIAAETFSIDRVRETVKELERALPKASNSLVFSVDEVLNRPIITVVDKKTGDVVRTLPSDEIIRVAHNIDKMKGILFEALS
jgi:flagellar protein FlaG